MSKISVQSKVQSEKKEIKLTYLPHVTVMSFP